jgi:hypothetical protein
MATAAATVTELAMVAAVMPWQPRAVRQATVSLHGVVAPVVAPVAVVPVALVPVAVVMVAVVMAVVVAAVVV